MKDAVQFKCNAEWLCAQILQARFSKLTIKTLGERVIMFKVKNKNLKQVAIKCFYCSRRTDQTHGTKYSENGYEVILLKQNISFQYF